MRKTNYFRVLAYMGLLFSAGLMRANTEAVLYPLLGNQEPVFSFKRSIQADLITDRYINNEGKLAIQEDLEKDPRGQIKAYRYHQAQLGEKGGLELEKDKVIIYRIKNGLREEKVLPRPEKLLFGPVVQDLIHQHWEQLLIGEKISAYVPVTNHLTLAAMDFYIEVSNQKNESNREIVIMRPSNWFFRLFISENRLIFDSKSRQLVEITGPSLLQIEKNGVLGRADLRVIYKNIEENKS